MKAYKGFNKDMTCRDFQYKEGESYETDRAELCKSGFHACENPLDCWGYYSLLDGEFHEVELDEVSEEREDDTKVCGKKIKIGAKLSIRDMVNASVEFVMNSVKGAKNPGKRKDRAKIGSSGYGAQIGSSGDGAQIGSSGDAAKIGSSGHGAQIGSSGDGAQIGSSGHGAQIGSSGYRAKIGSSGYGAQIGSSGDGAQIGSSGYRAKIGSSGDGAQIGSSGDGAQIGSSGDAAKIGSSGDGAQIGSSGDAAKIDMTGRNSVAAVVGNKGKIRGKIGCWIVLAEWGEVNEEYVPICVKAVQIDGEKYKQDTWYKMENGEIVEVE